MSWCLEVKARVQDSNDVESSRGASGPDVRAFDPVESDDVALDLEGDAGPMVSPTIEDVKVEVALNPGLEVDRRIFRVPRKILTCRHSRIRRTCGRQ